MRKRRLKERPMRQGNFDKGHPWRQQGSYLTDPIKGVFRVRRTKKKADS